MDDVVVRPAQARDRLGEDHRLARRPRVLEYWRRLGDVRLGVRPRDQHLPRKRNGRPEAHGLGLHRLRFAARGKGAFEQAPPVRLLEERPHIAHRRPGAGSPHRAVQVQDRAVGEDAGAFLPLRPVAHQAHGISPG